MAQKVNLDIAQKLNITCRRGDTFSLEITLTDESGAALTLQTSAYQFIMQVRTNAFADGSEGLILSTVNSAPSGATGYGVIDAMEGTTNITDEGKVTISISDIVMRAMSSGRYVYDLQQIVGGVHTTILTGSFVVNEDVTESLESE